MGGLAAVQRQANYFSSGAVGVGGVVEKLQERPPLKLQS